MRLAPLLWLFLVALAASPAQARLLPTTTQAYRLLPERVANPAPVHGDVSVAQASTRTLTLLDDGGGAPRMSYDRDRVVAILLSFIPGFGLGHFWINDDSGFFTFLIVDSVAWTAFVLRGWFGIFSVPIAIILVAVKVWQVVDLIRVSRGRGGGSDAPVFAAARNPQEERWGVVRSERSTDAPPVLQFSF